MPVFHVHFPALVSRVKDDDEKRYVVRPLLFPGPVGSHPELPEAERMCLRQIERDLERARVARDGLNDLLWLQFHPLVHDLRVPFDGKAGKSHVKGTFQAAWFEHGGHRWVCLPGFRHHLFLCPPEREGRYAMEERVRGVILRLLEQERKDAREEVPSPETHMEVPGSFVTYLAETDHVSNRRIALGGEPADLFELLSGRACDFDGETEILRVAEDLNRLFPDRIRRAHGLERLVERVGDFLFRPEISAAVLVGPSGVGKTTIVHEAVARVLEAAEAETAEAETVSFDTLPKVWHLDPNRLIAGMVAVGMWQKRFHAVLDHARTRLRQRYGIPKDDVLFVDNPVALLRLGKSAHNEMTLSDVLKPRLERRQQRLLCEATPEAWKRIQELDRRFADLFEVIPVPTLPLREALRVVVRRCFDVERRHRCRFSGPALARAVDLVRSYPGARALPGGAVDALERLASAHAGKPVEASDAEAAFQDSTGLRRGWFLSEDAFPSEDVESFLRSRLVGQEEALTCLLDALQVVKARLSDPEKPWASFLFLGPTGVGKTESAKALAEALFGEEGGLVRFDMNEYVDDEALGRLVGDLDRPEGQLTGRIRFRPFCVLLLDEIEKAHPSIHDLLLQALGDGRLTDALGRTVRLCNTVVVMTSNLGAEAARTAGFGAVEDALAGVYRKAVEDFFRPEFVNRIDRVVAFRRLSREDVLRIADIQMEKLFRREGFLRRRAFLDVSPAALDWVVERGFDPELGGRALKRSVEKELTALAAEALSAHPADAPLLFHVSVRQGRLHPWITPAAFAQADPSAALPAAPAKAGRDTLERWRDRMRTRMEELPEVRPEGGEWTEEQMRGPAAEIHAVRENLKGVLERVEARLESIEPFEKRPPFLYRTRRRKGTLRRYDGAVSRDTVRQLGLDQDLYEYIDGLYRAAPFWPSWSGPPAPGSSEEALEDLFFDVLRADFEGRHAAGGDWPAVGIHVRPCVPGAPFEDVRLLLSGYGPLVGTLEAKVPPQKDGSRRTATRIGKWWAWKNDQELYLTGRKAGGFELLRGESGIHLFQHLHGRSMLLQVRVVRLSGGEDFLAWADSDRAARARWAEAFERGEAQACEDPWLPGPVIRVYCPPEEGREGTVADLRTGLMDRFGERELPGRKAWFAWTYGVAEDRDGIG